MKMGFKENARFLPFSRSLQEYQVEQQRIFGTDVPSHHCTVSIFSPPHPVSQELCIILLDF